MAPQGPGVTGGDLRTELEGTKMELCVLASGSSGNCSVIRTNNGVFLVDCGLGPRVTAQRLNGTGVTVAQIQSICVTHLDRDHLGDSLAIRSAVLRCCGNDPVMK